MDRAFDISKFNLYSEDNRREVKKQKMDYQSLFGNLIQPLRIIMVV